MAVFGKGNAIGFDKMFCALLRLQLFVTYRFNLYIYIYIYMYLRFYIRFIYLFVQQRFKIQNN